MAKKSEEEAAVPAPKKRQRIKGNFGVFVRVEEFLEEVAEEERVKVAAWKTLTDGLASAADCEKYIKEIAEGYAGKTLMVAQIKKVAKVQVETQVKVSF